MANIKFTNFAHSRLAVGIGPGDTSISVTGGHGARFPALGAGEYFYATLEDASNNREIVKVTARATDVLTVVRAQDNTSALSWNAGDTIALRLNAAAITDFVDTVANTVKLTGDQTVAGVKTFSSAPVVPGLSDSGNLTFTGTGNRITGDFSNATVANRVAFQTSTANAATTVNVLPNGAATTAQLAVWNNADPTNGSTLTLSAQAAETRVVSGAAGSGTLLPLTFYTNNAERMRIDTSGNVGMATNNPGGFRLNINQATNALRVGDSVSDASNVVTLAGNGYTGNIGIDAVGLGIGHNSGSRSVYFYTASASRFSIDGSGNALVVSAGGGLGYGTGAGGTVTQATSKGTAVTLNRPTGQITTNNSALAAGAEVVFQFNNSVIGAGDNIIVTTGNSLALFSNYEIRAGGFGPGGCFIALKNVTGGSLSEAVVINFAIIKGAAS